MIAKITRLEFELFTRPSKSDFLRVHQFWVPAFLSEYKDILTLSHVLVYDTFLHNLPI